MAKKSTPIPGLTFSWKRALGITQAKQKISRKTGIPMTKQGIERKIGGAIIRKLFGKWRRRVLRCRLKEEQAPYLKQFP